MGDVYDLTLDSNGIADHNGTLTLAISPRMTIANYASNRLLDVSPIGIYESSFDVDNAEPRVIFNPESGRIHDPAGNLTLTFTEAVYSDSGGTAFTGSTLAGLIDLREDNESGSDIPFTASIDTGAFMATFTFIEAVTGFTASDVAVTNGTASALIKAQSGRQWHVRITPTGDYSVSLPGDRVTDLSEDMRGVDASDFAIDGATPAVAAAGSKSVYDLSVVRAELASVQGIVRLYFKGDGDITDLAGNALRAPRPPATRPLPSSSTTRR